MKRALPAVFAVGLLWNSIAFAAESVTAPPVSREHAQYAAEIASAQAQLDAFMAGFNARDVVAYEASFNFPHVRFHAGEVTTMKAGHHRPQMFERLAAGGWDRSGWLRRDVIHAGPDKVHIDTRFARYRKDGSLLGAFDSIYIVTRVDGRWGVQGRSSYAP